MGATDEMTSCAIEFGFDAVPLRSLFFHWRSLPLLLLTSVFVSARAHGDDHDHEHEEDDEGTNRTTARQ